MLREKYKNTSENISIFRLHLQVMIALTYNQQVRPWKVEKSFIE